MLYKQRTPTQRVKESRLGKREVLQNLIRQALR